jgi:hypothetical protein
MDAQTIEAFFDILDGGFQAVFAIGPFFGDEILNFAKLLGVEVLKG